MICAHDDDIKREKKQNLKNARIDPDAEEEERKSKGLNF